MRKTHHRIGRADMWTAISTSILALSALCALWYAHAQIREAHDEAQIQHLVTFVNEFDQEPMATYRKELADKRLNTTDDDPMELYRVLDFFETIGRLVDRGYLNEEDVWREFGYWVLHLNADSAMRANVDYEQQHNPNEYAEYLSLVARMQRIDMEHGGYLSHLSKDDVMAFYREELGIVGGTPPQQGHPSESGK
jgi:hypothetical protein